MSDMNGERIATSNNPLTLTKLKHLFQSNSLSRTIISWFLLLSVLPMTLVAWISYQQAHISLTQNAKDKLELAANSQIAFFDNWFNYRLMDLHSQAENMFNVHLLALLEEGFVESGNSSEKYVESYDWARRVDVAEDHLVTLSHHFDSIYDIFLIDTTGNILYTVARKPDLGTNLFTGPHSDTRFASTVKATLETGQSLFSDLEHYAVNDHLTSFLTAPLLDETGNIVGVYAVEIRLEKLFNHITSVNSLHHRSSQVHYLVGDDGYLRSAINEEYQDILKRKIDTEPFRYWKQRSLGDTQSLQNIDHYVGPDGVEMIGLYQTVQLPGVKWILVSEISQQRALTDANWLGRVILIILVLTSLSVSILAVFQARRITQPISQLVRASKAVTAGELDQKVTVATGNEIGTLAKTFNHMLEVLNKNALALETSNAQKEQALNDLAMQQFALDQHSIVAITDVTGTITFVNDKFTEISGYSQEELLGQNHRLLNSGHHETEFFRMLYRTIARGEVWHGEIKNKAKNGEFYWVDTTIVPFLDNEQKRPTSYIAIRTDITQRKYTEAAMQQAKEQTEQALKDLAVQKFALDQHSIVAVTDVAGTITFVNEKFTEISGYSQEELLGQNHRLLNSGHHETAFFRELYRTIAKGDVWHGEIKNKAKNGEFYWVDTTIVPYLDNDQKKPISYIAIRTDITQRKYTEAAMQQAKEQTEQALKDLAVQKFALDQHSIVAVTNVAGTITFVNEKFTEISGYSQEELLGQNHRLLNSGHHETAFFRELYRTIAKGDVWHGEIKNKAKNGDFYWVDTTIVPYLDNDRKKPISYIAIRTDITQRKHTEAAIKKAKEVAEAANQAKGMFLANMSHEIRTPMNGIIGMTGLLLDTELDETQRGRALSIRRSGESLLNIINDILDFSKIEAGRFDLEIIDFDLGELMEDFADTIALRAAEKGLELICPAHPELHNWYKGDPGRIRQILTNLVGNAIKFTEQGEVSVRYSLEKQLGDRNMLRFEVIDTGIGLDAEQEEKLFVRFSQADNSTTRQYGGTGLGLAISKQLTELMGGEIGFESKLGQGSNFWFTINLEIAEEQSSPICAASLQNQRILVVDDNNTNLELLDQILDVWGIEHGLAKDGPVALTILKEAASADKPYHIALLDMQMPGMDGAHIGALIQNNKQLSNTRLVMITSQGRQGDAKKMQEIGFTGYLCKPIRQSELFNVLQQVAGVENSHTNKRLITRYTSREHQQKQFVGRVLVVEDNITNQQVAQGMLEKFGLYVDVAANGHEAIQALEKLSYDIVFMDCQMPVMDGYTATKRIRIQPSLTRVHTVPIVGLTANAMRGDRDICLAAGMDDYISKPVDPGRLRQALVRWLPNYQYKNKAQEKPSITGNAMNNDSTQINNSSETQASIKLVFDHAALYSRLMDDEALIRTVAESFIVDMSKQIELFKLAVDANDIEKATSQAHKIKGGSANMGGMVLSTFAYQMELAGKAGDLTTLREGSERIEQDFEQLKIALEEKLF